MSSDPTTCECRQFLLDALQRIEPGIDVHISILPPIVPSPFGVTRVTCPHGIDWYSEPTSDQQAQWAKDGVL